MRAVAVLGLGLIGGSALRALAAAGIPARGYDPDPDTRAQARGAATSGGWRVADRVADAVDGADVVLLAMPLPAVPAALPALAGFAGLVSDVVSVKRPVHDAVRDTLPGVRFVGGHPMAGRELSGFAAGDAGLFAGRAWVLCLEPDTALDDWLAVAGLATALGARVVPATAAEHDAAVARISHLPHLLAAALAAAAATPLDRALAAGSFADGTRVAATRPALVAAMCGGNAAPVADALNGLLADLGVARDRLSGPDPVAGLTGWLGTGNAARAGWPPEPGAPEEMAADREALLALGRAGGAVLQVDPDDTLTVIRPAG